MILEIYHFVWLPVIALLYIFLVWNNNYWKKLGVNGPQPCILFGNTPSALTKKRHISYDLWDIYKAFKDSDYYVGIFHNRTPQLLILKPALARQIYVTDFKHFHDNIISTLIDEKVDYLFANNPFVAAGSNWKQKRSELIPALSLGRIKAMFPMTLTVCKRLTTYLRKEYEVSSCQQINSQDLCLRFMADILADCIMGLNSDSFLSASSPIMDMHGKMFEVPSFYIFLENFIPSLRKLGWKRRFITKEFENYVINLIKNAIDLRKTNPLLNNRADFLTYILELQEKKSLTLHDISAHAVTFLLDGFETTASVMSNCLLMLARYPPAQQKLREEIQQNLSDKLDCDVLAELPYMNACIYETLRFLPVTFYGRKLCTEPLEIINKNGSSLLIPKGMTVIVPHYHIMMDESIYKNAFDFQPERFLPENGGVKKYLDMGAYWGYGDGPRVCLGIKFGLMQIKAALTEIVTNFRIRVNPKTRPDFRFDATYFLPRLDGGVWLEFTPIHK